MRYSEFHIDGWLTDFECTTDFDDINDVITLNDALDGYAGRRFITAREAGILEDPNAKYLPNGPYTSVIAEADWPAAKAYIEETRA